MGINPSGRGSNNNDLWISGAHHQHEDVQDAGTGPSGVVGSHNISTKNNTHESSSFLSRIASAVRSFFAGIFGDSSSRANSRASTPTPSDTPPPLTSLSVKTSPRGVSPSSSLTKSNTSSVASGSSARPLKRKAPQPPSEGSTQPKLQRRGSASAMSSIDSNDSTASRTSQEISSGIADKLKAELEAHHKTKQERLAKLSDQIKERWTNHEAQEPIAYKLACLQTVTSRLGQARLEAQQEISVLRPGIHEFPLNTAISLSRSIWDLGEKEQRQDGESVLLPVLVRMGLEGPKLGPDEDFVNYVEQIIGEYGEPEETYNWQGTLQSLARDLNSLRETNPNGMKKFWSSFAGKGEITMRMIANRFASANVGKYDPNSVRVERRWNTGALDLMNFLSSEAYVKTASILAYDALSVSED